MIIMHGFADQTDLSKFFFSIQHLLNSKRSSHSNYWENLLKFPIHTFNKQQGLLILWVSKDTCFSVLYLVHWLYRDNVWHDCSDQIAVKQSQVDKLYAGLKDLAGERRAKLEEGSKLFVLKREVDDLEQWIQERELVASSQELGQDYDHVTVSSF